MSLMMSLQVTAIASCCVSPKSESRISPHTRASGGQPPARAEYRKFRFPLFTQVISATDSSSAARQLQIAPDPGGGRSLNRQKGISSGSKREVLVGQLRIRSFVVLAQSP
jgi:hypothetical protein